MKGLKKQPITSESCSWVSQHSSLMANTTFLNPLTFMLMHKHIHLPSIMSWFVKLKAWNFLLIIIWILMLFSNMVSTTLGCMRRSISKLNIIIILYLLSPTMICFFVLKIDNSSLRFKRSLFPWNKAQNYKKLSISKQKMYSPISDQNIKIY